MLRVNDFYENWIKKNKERPFVKELMKLKDMDTNKMPYEEVKMLQQKLEDLMFQEETILSVNKLHSFALGSIIDIHLEKLKDLIRERMIEKMSAFEDIAIYKINAEDYQNVFHFSLVNCLRRILPENEISIKENALIFEMSSLLYKLITCKSEIIKKVRNHTKQSYTEYKTKIKPFSQLESKTILKDLKVNPLDYIYNRSVDDENNDTNRVYVEKDKTYNVEDEILTEALLTQIKTQHLYDICRDIVKLAEKAEILNAVEEKISDKLAFKIKAVKTAERKDTTSYKHNYRSPNKKILNELLTACSVERSRLPMLVEPLVYNKNNGNYLGGYLLSHTRINNRSFELILYQQENIILIVDEAQLNAINYLMTRPLEISEKMLNKVLNQSTESLKTEFNIDLNLINQTYVKNPYEEIDPNIYQAEYFLYSLFVADALKNKKIYLLWYFDGRGRMYNVNTPISFHSNLLFRSLFKFYNEVPEEGITLDKAKLLKLKPHELNNYALHGDNSLIGIDATNSAYQIIGGLLMDERMLEFTNVITKAGANTKADLYNYILEILLKRLDYENLSISYKTYLISLRRADSSTLEYAEKELKQLIITRLTRKTIKKPVMTLAYNQSLLAASKELNAAVLDIKKPNFALNSIFMEIVKTIHQIIFDEFPKFHIFQKALRSVTRSLTNEEKGLIKVAVAGHEFTQSYYNSEIERLTFHSKFDKKKVTIHKYKQTKDLNPTKNSIAFMPNFIHFIDSSLAVDVILACKEASIDILTIHDCFYARPKDLEKVREFYKKSYKKIILESNLIEDFYKLNNVDLKKTNHALYEILQEISPEKRYEIISKCENKNILF